MITERVARFVAETSSAKIPEAALAVARSAITDFVGVALAGSREEVGAMIGACVKEMGAEPSAGVIGKGFRTAPQLAALANGTIGHALDYDDLSFVYGGHPSVTLAPVLLSLGETVDARGVDVLAAYVIGFEACARMSSPLAQSHYAQGWHSTGNIGILGATAAAAKLLKLDVGQVRRAFGIAASMAGGLRINFGTMTKPLHAGNAASNAVLAVQLSRRGFTAREDVVEAPLGYGKVFGCTDEIDWGEETADLGERFLITDSAIGFKPYPSCGGTLGVTDAALCLREQFSIDPVEIERVVLGVGPFENGVLNHNPSTGLEGKFSLEYCVARALLDGSVGLRSFTDERVNQPAARSLVARTECVERYPMAVMGTGAAGMNPQSVTIRMRDGREYFRETPMQAGMPVTPMSEGRLDEKYRDCASLVLDRDTVEESLGALHGLKSLASVRELMRLVVAECGQR